MKRFSSFPVIAFFICAILIFFGIFVSNPLHFLTWDVFGYYLYLPAKFIYNDITLQSKEWLDSLIKLYEPTGTLYQATLIENGNWVMKYTMGLAVAYSPFFFIGHFIAGLLSQPQDGLSAPYQLSIAAGSYIVILIGLYYSLKFFKLYFDSKTSAVLLLLIVFGTNFFQMTTSGGSLLSHHYVFMLMAVMIYHLEKWHVKERKRDILIVGFSIGFATLIRPSEAVMALIPMFWRVYDGPSFKEKISLIKRNFLWLTVAVLVALLCVLPQLLYWKAVTGKYVYDSYVNPGEGFEFSRPFILEYLFSFRKGWLIYTPLVVISLVALWIYRKKIPFAFTAIIIYTIVNLYIVSSWSCWWYAGGSFSARSMLPWYVLMALPLGLLISTIKKKKKKVFVTAMLSVLVVINLFQSWQFYAGIITRETMTAKYYFAIFGKTSVPEGAERYLLVDRGSSAEEKLPVNLKTYIKKSLGVFDFEDGKNNRDTAFTGKGSFLMSSSIPFSPGIDIKYNALTDQDHGWISSSCKIFIPQNFKGPSPELVTTFHHEGEVYKYRVCVFPSDSLKKGKWNTFRLDYITPEVRSPEDNVKVYVWNRSSETIYLDDLQIQFYEPFSQEMETRNLNKNTANNIEKLTSENPFISALEAAVGQLKLNDNAVLRSTVKVFIPEDFKDIPPVLVTALHFGKEVYGYQKSYLHPDQITKGGWQEISLDYRLPDIKSQQDILKIYLWHRGADTLQINHFEVDILEPQE